MDARKKVYDFQNDINVLTENINNNKSAFKK